jgi:hypothetical protein
MQASVLRDIGRSWMSLKTWVKLWLFWINAVMLAGIGALPDDLGVWTLVAYLLCAPLLLWLMLRQRGLTRLLGLAHIVPWLPLLIYALLRLTGAAVGPHITFATSPGLAGYALVLVVTLITCLAFDTYDVIRYARGEQYVMGSPDAAAAGASALAR